MRMIKALGNNEFISFNKLTSNIFQTYPKSLSKKRKMNKILSIKKLSMFIISNAELKDTLILLLKPPYQMTISIGKKIHQILEHS